MGKLRHISHVKSSVLGRTPSAETLNYGEIAINYNSINPSIFIKDSKNNVIQIANNNNKVESWHFSYDIGENVGYGEHLQIAELFGDFSDGFYKITTEKRDAQGVLSYFQDIVVRVKYENNVADITEVYNGVSNDYNVCSLNRLSVVRDSSGVTRIQLRTMAAPSSIYLSELTMHVSFLGVASKAIPEKTKGETLDRYEYSLYVDFNVNKVSTHNSDYIFDNLVTTYDTDSLTDSLMDTINIISGDVNTIFGNIDDININISTLSGAVDDNSESIDGILDDLNSLHEDLETISGAVDNIITGITNDFEETEYQEEFSNAEPIEEGLSFDSAFTRVEHTIKALAEEVLTNEKIVSKSISVINDSCGLTENGKYEPSQDMSYAKLASTISDAIELLDDAIVTETAEIRQEIASGGKIQDVKVNRTSVVDASGVANISGDLTAYQGSETIDITNHVISVTNKVSLSGHTHTSSEITDFKDAVATAATDKNLDVTPYSGSDTIDITNHVVSVKDDVFASKTHGHVSGDITDFSDAVSSVVKGDNTMDTTPYSGETGIKVEDHKISYTGSSFTNLTESGTILTVKSSATLVHGTTSFSGATLNGVSDIFEAIQKLADAIDSMANIQMNYDNGTLQIIQN